MMVKWTFAGDLEDRIKIARYENMQDDVSLEEERNMDERDELYEEEKEKKLAYGNEDIYYTFIKIKNH